MPSQVFSRLLLIYFFISYAFLNNAQSILYVTESGTGDFSGSSWINSLPGNQLQSRLKTIEAGKQVWVARGTYKPTITANRAVSFAMRNGVSIYGGFQGNESSIEQRPPITASQPSSSTLSGDIGTTGDVEDNSYHVINNRGIDSTAVLDGFVITLGNESGSSAFPYAGGGMLNDGSGPGNYCSPVIKNCFFTKNRAEGGGAVYNGGSSSGYSAPHFLNCIFDQNTAFNSNGGAIKNTYSSPSFVNCLFHRNRSEYFSGGAIAFGICYVGNSKPSIVNCIFSQNSAVFYGGAVYFGSLYEGVATPIILNCTFTKNYITQLASAVYFDDYQGRIKAKMVNCIAWGNTGRNPNIVALSSYLSKQDVTYSNIQNFSLGVYPGTGNIMTDPIFVDPANNDFRLQPTSPCINTGDPLSSTATTSQVDFTGENRVQEDRIDMGAYEYQYPICSSGLYTLKDGQWNDTAVWSCGKVPTTTDRVLIKHIVTIPQNYVGEAKRVTFEAGSQLLYTPDARLQLSQ
ncbi:hypothetical protein GCM10028806_56050 [Spirosoma terrae]|uniref:Right-handed parallel beta-helix repeat-containing protein n=1 Tax=Spirosoma terrae TaxID=1968276 RepID=A0A6L9LQS4_9BACT|nr:choice-of-anchor Q domain-containing protein [Spirosoma terrae]NDU99339.1 hypothetical protein [Spirosoma terrae]